MTHSTVLFDSPRHKIAGKIIQLLDSSTEVSIVSGFLTEGGIKHLAHSIKRNPLILKNLVIGAGTFQAFKALDGLIKSGVPQNRLHVNLGYSRFSKSTFIKYHPMLHSKIYYFEKDNGFASAIIGSHNITDFALSGKNGEASVLLEVKQDEQPFIEIRDHILDSIKDSTPYNSSMKEAYSWWAGQFVAGLKSEICHDVNSNDIENKKTIVVFSVHTDPADMPKINDTIYLDIPEAFNKLRSLNDQVHFYIMPKLTSSSRDAIKSSHTFNHAFEASVEGTNMGGAVKEVSTDWYIQDIRKPIMSRSLKPFQPSPLPNEIWVILRVKAQLKQRYEYLFNKNKLNIWSPIFDKNNYIEVGENPSDKIENSKLKPQEPLFKLFLY